MGAAASGNVLELRGVSKRFGGVRALTAVTVDVPARTIFGIIGPNGAGKTTLFNCISGLLRPDTGSSICYRGMELVGRAPHRIAQLGISRTFQNIALIRDQSARQNILTGMHLALPYSPLASLFPAPSVRRREAEALLRIAEVADLLQLSDQILRSRVDALSLGQQKKIEVARAVVRRPDLLMLDEPAGGLDDRETEDLIASVRTLHRHFDVSIILIDHDMGLVMALCDRLCVLDFGEMVAEGPPEQIQADPAVISVYLGSADAA
jgi:branched-chain amino acid transport system ATP-binding protein